MFNKDHDNSVTHSGINTSNINIANEDKQQQFTGETAGQMIVDIHTGVTRYNYKDQAGYWDNNPYQNPMNWDVNQLRNEQTILQSVHEKYLSDYPVFNLVGRNLTYVVDNISKHEGIPKVDIPNYKSRVEYGCALMGYKDIQGCKP